MFGKRKSPELDGRLIKNYGVLFEFLKGIVKFRYVLLLIEKHNKKKVVLKETSSLVGMHDRYFEFDKDSTQKLKDALGDALKFM